MVVTPAPLSLIQKENRTFETVYQEASRLTENVYM